MISYHNKRFRPTVDSNDGEVDASTVFEYFESNGVVWATYAGGNIQFGTLVANKLSDGRLDMRYTLLTSNGVLKSGICETVPEVTSDGKLRLHESWKWTEGDIGAGTSILEEITDDN